MLRKTTYVTKDPLYYVTNRVSLETYFDSILPKLKPKLIWALGETKCLFRLFVYRCSEFRCLIKPKRIKDQSKTNQIGIISFVTLQTVKKQLQFQIFASKQNDNNIK
jgi:hypothetical protein